MCLNDYELLYLIYEKDDTALEIMFDKYAPLIHARIRDFRIQKNKDDFFQEGLLSLNKSINRFSSLYSKTFTNYFDLVLQRKFIQILRKEKNYFYNVVFLDEIDFLKEDPKEEVEVQERFGFLSGFENQIYYCNFVQKMKPREIAIELEIGVSQVYNAIGRLKKKIKDKANL